MTGEPKPSPSMPPGPGVDAQGRPVIDPTENVKLILEAAIARQDDLRTMQAVYTDKIAAYQEKIAELRAEHNAQISDMQAQHQAQTQATEAGRLDAIRAVDQARVTADAAAAETRATALQSQVALSADVVRNALDAKVSPILEAIAALQRAQYETAGSKAQIVETRDVNTEHRGANSAMVAVMAAGIAFLLLIVAVVSAYAALKK